MSLLQTGYIYLMKPLAAVNTEKTRPVREGLVVLCFFLLFAGILIGDADPDKAEAGNGIIQTIFGMTEIQQAIAGGALLFLAAVFGVNQKLAKVEWNWLVGYLWLFTCLLIIISGCFHNIGNGVVLNQLMAMLIIPLLLFVWQSQNSLDKLYALLCGALVLLVFVVAILSIVKFAWGTDTLREGTNRYMSFFNNPNRLGFFAVTGTVASVYLGTYLKKYWCIIPAVSLGVCCQFSWLSASRSSIVAITLVLLAGSILYLKNGSSGKMLLIMIVSAMIAFAAAGLFIGGSEDQEGEEEAVFNHVSLISAVYAEDTEEETGGGSGSEAIDRLKGNEDLGYTSGRLEVWERYYSLLTVAGNDIDYYLPVRAVNKRSEKAYYGMAHNTPLEIAFRSGIPAGILFLLLEIAGFAYCLVRLFGRREKLRIYDTFSCLAIIAFLIVGTFESLVGSMNDIFNTDVAVLFYLAMGGTFLLGTGVRKDESSDQCDNPGL